MPSMWIQMKRHFQIRISEWFNACLLMAWGAFLILVPNVFDGPASVVFTGMADFARQEVWGFAAFVVGTIRMVALFINGRWGLTPIIRVITSFLSVFVWFWVCVGLSRAGFPQTGMVVYPGLMLLDMYSAFRAASDAYEVEANRRLEEKLLEGSSSVHRLHRS